MEPISSKLVCPGSYEPYKKCPNKPCKSAHLSCPGSFERIQECLNQSCKEEHTEKDGIKMHQNEFEQKWIDKEWFLEKKHLLIVHEKWKDQFYIIDGFLFLTNGSGGSWDDREYRTSHHYQSFTFLLKEVQVSARIAKELFATFTQDPNEKTKPYLLPPLIEIIADYAAADPLDELNKGRDLLEE